MNETKKKIPIRELKIVSSWSKEKGKHKEYELSRDLWQELEKWKNKVYEDEWDQNLSQMHLFFIDQANNLRNLLSDLDYRSNFPDKDTRQILGNFQEWLNKENYRCGGCDISENKTSLVKCQNCRYYFCPPCWGKGNNDFCQDCKNGNPLKFN